MFTSRAVGDLGKFGEGGKIRGPEIRYAEDHLYATEGLQQSVRLIEVSYADLEALFHECLYRRTGSEACYAPDIPTERVEVFGYGTALGAITKGQVRERGTILEYLLYLELQLFWPLLDREVLKF